MGWGHFSNWGGGRSAWGGKSACQSKSYHDGGVRDGGFDRWYSDKLSNHFGGRGGRKHWQRDDDHGSGTGGTGGTGGGHGRWGKKKWWQDRNRDEDENGSGTGGSGMGGSGTGGSGTGGSGTGGSGKDGCGTGGGRGGHGRWGKKKWWQDRNRDEDGNGSGTGGSGTGGSGTAGTGTGGTGTAGTGTGGTGTGGSGTGGSGTSGSGTGGTGDGGDGGTDGKTSVSFEIGGNGDPSVTVEVTQTPQGQLFIKLEPTSYDGEVADVDGLFFNMSDDATVDGLNFFPDENALPVTGHAAEANAVNSLDDGATVPENYDGMVQFGQAADSTDGTVNNANFTLWSDSGLTLDDIDLSSMSLVVSNPDGSQDVLSGGYDPAAAASDSSSYANGGVSDAGLETWYAANTAPSGGSDTAQDTGAPGTEEIMALMNQPVEDPAEDCREDEMESDCIV
ncbi:hypothetical protein [Pseudophaeobacter sp.]|uniref:hypothetical protein n=1 Tax=Pseudophaeobacter sp. TaxID=1971739 RepID=UPI003299F1CA